MTDLMQSAGILLLSALMAVAVVSCGGSDDVTTPDTLEPFPPQSNTDRPIVFTGRLSESENENFARTRAGETSVPLGEFPDAEHGHKTFHAWAYKNTPVYTHDVVMKDYSVNWTSGSAGTTTTNSNGWEYVDQGSGSAVQDIKYWDFSATDYRFFAYTGSLGTSGGVSYSPASAPTSVTLSCSYPDAGAAVTSETPLYSKLWYKTGSDIATSVKPVTLEFLRPIARVRFMFTFAEGLSYGRESLLDIKFSRTDGNNVAKGGTVTITYPLTDSVTEESWTSTYGDPYDNNELAIDYYERPVPSVTPVNTLPTTYPNTPQKWYYVLPRKGPGDQGSFTLSVVVVGGDPKTCVVPAEFMTWAPGHDYTYIFKITVGGGVSLDLVQVGINSWDVKAAVEHPVYNW
jgi:hypothetical protein